MFRKKKEDSDDRNLSDAVRELGFNVPEGARISEIKTVAFGLSPDGIQGADMLAQIIGTSFQDARISGAPPDVLARFACSLLGGFALVIGNSLAGAGDIDEENELARIAAIEDISTDERCAIALVLCESAAAHVREYGPWAKERDEREAEEKASTPPLVDAETAEELKRMFRGESPSL